MIAAELYISTATVKVHVRHIIDKLGARSRTEVAARMAMLE
jgi:DNA-binding NarL/FixJ family response regulator